MKEQNALPTKGTKRSVRISPGVAACLKCLITVWAFSGESLSLMLSGYSMDVPGVKYLFTVLDFLDGWGIENLFMALGLGTVFYLVRDRQKNPGVSVLSFFFAVCTVFGISYAKTDSWDCIFLFKMQFLLAVFVMLGYYFAYKNCILFVAYVFEKKKQWLRREPSNRLEVFLFKEHTFWGPFLVIFVLGLPWLIAFFPGTLQWDAHAQLWMYLGVVEKTGHHPVAMTELMGSCISLGRFLFGSDSIGLFLYTFPQFLIQTFTFSYACYVLRRIGAPILFSWCALILWSVYPFFPIWGYTMVKDTPYYIFILLMVVTLQDMFYQRDMTIKKWQILLFLISIIGIALTRNDGRYIIYITIAVALLGYRKYWKIWVAGFGVCFLTVFAVEGIYMKVNDIASGPTGEMLSIPLQQTARYLREHYEEITEEEARVLQEGFMVELNSVGNMYNPIISDPVKENFVKCPDSDYLKSYFTVWLGQFIKHPDTYIQAFLNHVYGYFYPNLHGYGGYLAIFYIGNAEQWHDGYLDIEYVIQNNNLRKLLENTLYLMEKTPIISMFLSAGLHTFLLLGEFTYLWCKRRKKEIAVLVPAFVVLLICMASPVNAYLRYVMPIMVTLPVNVAWCYALGHREATEAIRIAA